jgi:hypothetical protein
MVRNAMTIRRVIGAAALGVAVVLLVLGETVLKDKLSPVAFVLFWTLCFFFTISAILCAYFDLRALRQSTRRAHQELLESAFKEIERKARQRQDRG